MHRPRELRRLTLAALTVAACLGWGCAGGRAPRTLSEAPLESELSPDQERRAEAIAHYATALSLEMDGGLDASLPEYAKAFELDPHYTALGIRLAQVYLGRKDYTNALAVLESARKANPTSADPLLWIGVAYRTSDQIPKAIPPLKQALKLEPTNLSVIRALLEIYLGQNATNKVVALLDRAFRRSSNDTNYWMGLGDLYSIVLRQKPTLAKEIDRSRIRQCYEKATELAPNDPDVLVRLADIYLDANDFERAAEAYTKLLSLRPNLPQLRERLAFTYIRDNQKEKAIAVMQELIKRDPLRFETYNSLGDLYDQLGQEDKAVDSYQESLVLNPNQIEVYVRIVLAQLQLKKYDDAFKTLADAKEKFPTRYQVQYLYGLAYSDQKEYDKAVASYADAEQLARDVTDDSSPSAAFYYAYGSACERAGDFDKAVALFKKALELDPNNDEACNYLGYMWADKGVHLDEALDLIQKALKERPDSGAYIDSLGWVYYKMGRYEEALPQLRRAVEVIEKDDKQQDATVLDHLAEVLLKLGKRDEAIAEWRRALQVEPDNKQIAEKLQKYSEDRTAVPK
jgi:tetratricopeptide (TPR) repeat protein